jgi:hypothetical protein
MHELDSHLIYDVESSEALKNAVQAWIALVFQPANTVYQHTSSYGMKHRFEGSAGNSHAHLYMTNGEFKGAMLAAGYEPVDREALNWMFRLKPRSPLKLCSKKHWNCDGLMRFCLCHCTQQERDAYADVLAVVTETQAQGIQ